MHQETYWKKMADKQQQQNIMRIKAQQEYQQKIKKAYMNQLSSQLREKQQMKRRQRQMAKQHDQYLINQGIQRQKQEIQRQHQRQQLIHQRQEYLASEGKRIENARKQQVRDMTNREKMLEQQGHELAKMAQQIRAQEQLRRKRALNNELLQTIQDNTIRKKQMKQYEMLKQRAVLNQGQHKKLIDQMRRVKFYHDLREKSKVVDYGSHKIIEEKANGRLLDRKRQEWQKEREAVLLNERLKQIEERSRQAKTNLDHSYGRSLKEQIQMQEAMKREQKEAQIMRERRNIQYAQSIANERLKMKQSQQIQMKRQLGKLLQEQARQRQSKSIHDRQMNYTEAGMNREFLAQEPSQRRSIDTFEMDPLRKRQYATLEKSLKIGNHDNSFSPGKQQPNYFARRGYSILN